MYVFEAEVGGGRIRGGGGICAGGLVGDDGPYGLRRVSTGDGPYGLYENEPCGICF